MILELLKLLFGDDDNESYDGEHEDKERQQQGRERVTKVVKEHNLEQDWLVEDDDD